MRLADDALLAIIEHVYEGYPYEACGVLLGRWQDGVANVEAVQSVVNRETDQPRVRYQIAPEDLLAVQRQARREGRDVLGYYHSHPDHPARPSETDRRIAAEGLSDGVIHMVVAVDGRSDPPHRIATPSAWIFRDVLAGFEPEPLEAG